MESCIYEGWVRHRRFEPCEHSFRYQFYMMYLDLAELPGLFDSYWLWSAKRLSVSWFRRSEHLGPADEPLDVSVRKLVKKQTGLQLLGPIRLLTSLRQFGFQMNPVSYFYCFDTSGTQLQAVVAEVNNTPWGQQHTYVIECAAKADHEVSRKNISQKVFHVSPFMQMNMEYHWKLPVPAKQLNIHIRNEWLADDLADKQHTHVAKPETKTPFDVTMSMRRKPITHRSMAWTLVRYPMVTAKVFAGIYWQALRLWWKKVPFVPHPGKVVDGALPRKTPSVDSTVQSSVQA